jgi:hypothetical protein
MNCSNSTTPAPFINWHPGRPTGNHCNHPGRRLLMPINLDNVGT